ncbi:unnamed protein product [Dracunculus medinensis]|uniref:TIL domain-containing protein n=1 Tax=Dracunculus medinensis TaxID=318479 RepID=A0A0N4UK66_DRAME|nr:unnamed protein product [Dracunculus medinensis]
MKKRNGILFCYLMAIQPHRHVPKFPRRHERNRLDCRTHERFVRCGPEPHCEMSCENLFSPPHCHTIENHPKCYYPRCICKNGFVRNKEGFCIREWRCPNRFTSLLLKFVNSE